MSVLELLQNPPISYTNLNVVSVEAKSIHSGPNNGPVSTCQYSQLSGVAVSNALSGSLSSGATFTGSLSLPPLPVGSVVKIVALGSASALVGVFLNFALYVNGSSVLPISGAVGAISNLGTKLEAYIVIKSSTVASLYFASNISGVIPNSQQTATFIYDSESSNSIDLFVNFSAANILNAFLCTSFFVELSNAN